MEIFHCISFLLFILLPAVLTLVPEDEMYHTKLRTLEACRMFKKVQKADIAKAKAYYDSATQQFFIDDQFSAPLYTCILEIADDTRPRSLIYSLHKPNFQDTLMIEQISNISVNAGVNNVDAIVQIVAFPGPKGNPADLPKGLQEGLVKSAVLFAAAEKETLTAVYGQTFFNSTCIATNYHAVTAAYLRLNGWHIRNMKEPPEFTNCDIYAAAVVYVEDDHAHLISRNMIRRMFTNFTMPLVLDMPNSPDDLNGVCALSGETLWMTLGMLILLLERIF